MSSTNDVIKAAKHKGYKGVSNCSLSVSLDIILGHVCGLKIYKRKNHYLIKDSSNECIVYLSSSLCDRSISYSIVDICSNNKREVDEDEYFGQYFKGKQCRHRERIEKLAEDISFVRVPIEEAIDILNNSI